VSDAHIIPERAVLERARLFEKGGDLLKAYDVLVEGLAQHPDSRDLKHRAVLVLARAGAGEQARREFQRLGLAEAIDDEDVLALGGRLLKDLALAADGDARRTLAADSAENYARAYALHHGYYPGINTATMTLLAGDSGQAAKLANAVLLSLRQNNEPTPEQAYYVAATTAEAHLLCGRLEAADDALATARARNPRDYAAHASTLRQFGIICEALALDSAWLDRHRPPPALFYCGHMFNEGANIADLHAEVRESLAVIRPGAVFGALAAGSDIIVAEAALAAGAELHVILPMREADYLTQSVAPYGAAWKARYRSCVERATTFRLATHEPFLGDDSVFAYGTEIAMGLAVRHADVLQTRAQQLALWDGAAAAGVAGTGADIARWEATGRRRTVIDFPKALRQPPAHKVVAAAVTITTARTPKAMLFADVRGFSKLEEHQITLFVERILAPLAARLRGLSVQPQEVATWGDGLYVVYDDVHAAATGALALLKRFSEIDLEGAGLPGHLALRVGGHAGPVTELTDPFMGTKNFFGTHVTIAARIEPVTVPGALYVSEPFAALLSLSAPGRYRTDYVGQSELAKKFGAMRLFAVSEM